jgi:FeS assembly protein IscX
MRNKFLYWNDYPAIAEALHKKYPDKDLVTLEDEQMLELIGSLETFRDDIRNVPKDILFAIFTVWVYLQDTEASQNDGLFDAYT